MPITYRFDSTIVVIELVGEYSLDDIPKRIINSLADSHCPISPSILIDLGGSQSIYHRTTRDIITAVNSLSTVAKHFNNRIALVAPNDVSFGLMRMGSVFSEYVGFKPEVFRQYLEAREWLLS